MAGWRTFFWIWSQAIVNDLKTDVKEWQPWLKAIKKGRQKLNFFTRLLANRRCIARLSRSISRLRRRWITCLWWGITTLRWWITTLKRWITSLRWLITSLKLRVTFHRRWVPVTWLCHDVTKALKRLETFPWHSSGHCKQMYAPYPILGSEDQRFKKKTLTFCHAYSIQNVEDEWNMN